MALVTASHTHKETVKITDNYRTYEFSNSITSEVEGTALERQAQVDELFYECYRRVWWQFYLAGALKLEAYHAKIKKYKERVLAAKDPANAPS